MARQKSTIRHNPLAAMTTEASEESDSPQAAAAEAETVAEVEPAMDAPVAVANDIAAVEPPQAEHVETAAAAPSDHPETVSPPVGPAVEPAAAAAAPAEPAETVVPLDGPATQAAAMAEPDDFVADGPAVSSAQLASDESEARRRAGIRIVRRFMAWSGAAGLLPLPAVDVASAAAVQIKMLHTLALLYGVPFNAALARQLIMALLGGGGSVMLALPAASAAKTVPVVGTVASMLLSPAFTSLSCYVTGRAFLGHFEAGGTLENFDLAEIQAKAAEHARAAAAAAQ